ncbi:unnamed protein product [Gadus morhua 'NCC']
MATLGFILLSTILLAAEKSQRPSQARSQRPSQARSQDRSQARSQARRRGPKTRAEDAAEDAVALSH